MPAKRDSRSGEKTSRSLGIAAYSDDPNQQRSDFDWTFLSQMDSSGTHSEQYKLILQIREFLKQYSMFDWMRACRGAHKTNEQIWLQAQLTSMLILTLPGLPRSTWFSSEIKSSKGVKMCLAHFDPAWSTVYSSEFHFYSGLVSVSVPVGEYLLTC